MQRPTGVTIIAAICFLNTAYIGIFAVLSRFFAIPVYLGTEVSRQLQVGWPYVPLAFGTAWALIGWGLLRLHNWARWAVMLTAVWGIASGLSQAVVFPGHLGWRLPKIVVCALAVWYLFRMPVADQFRNAPRTSPASPST